MFAFAALTMGAVAVILQLGRVTRGHKLGVSATTWAFLTVMQTGWAAFYYKIDQPWVAFGALLFTPFTTLIVAGVAKEKIKAVLFTAGAATLLAAGVTLAGAAGELILGLFASVAFLPQVVVVIRALRERSSLDGVSIASWTWTTVVTVLWLAQGLVFAEPAMISANIVLLLSCAVILGGTVTQPKRLNGYPSANSVGGNQTGE